ncbi:ABC transporter permease [Labedaea rhizosphaerae]|uniref:ABC-2 family transporter n=1 Tax=Labedaea rhizosphaerae TaxID=598644 RepID=A0A4R6S493_LABRH|nr:ABC transporter permease subunit [Labedaea rhizosphaerae]TDP93907.1 ABC-2 family transporter [Labedaea rhizosphaerae]
MGRLIAAEYRKIFTTKLWWALLIPAAIIALVFAWGGSALGALQDEAETLGGSLPLAFVTFAYGYNFATIFGLIFGATSLTGELRHKTITTSYLTGSSRGAVLAAKLFTYTTIGALYGIICAITGTIGSAIGDEVPAFGAWTQLMLASILVMIMWVLLGVGVGALIGNQVGAVVSLIVYVLVVERVLAPVMNNQGMENVVPYLPYQSAANTTMELAVRLLFGNLPGDLAGDSDTPQVERGIRTVLLLNHVPDWWTNGVIFAVWALVLGIIGWLVARRRDIT